MKCIRVVGFVAGLAVSLAAPAQENARKGMRTASRSDLEKQLYEIGQKWLEAARTQNLKLLEQLWTDRFFEILPGGQRVSKAELLDLLAKAERRPGKGAFADDFKLRSRIRK